MNWRSSFYFGSFVLVAAVVACFVGCSQDISPGADIEQATKVTFTQFKAIVELEGPFYWNGSDKNYHYFQTRKGFYRIDSRLKMPDFQNQIESRVARGYAPGTMKSSACIDGDTIASGWIEPHEDF